MPETRECSMCEQPFTAMRTVGRPRSICSPACKLESGRRRQARWRQRANDARAQLAALQAHAA